MTGQIVLLHADEHVVVVDKPARTLVVSAPGRTGPILEDLVSRQLGARVHAVHRLDEDTTGVLVLARNAGARPALEAIFRRHRAARTYLALVARTPSPPAGRIESHLLVGSDGVVRSSPDGRGERAVTEYRMLARRGRNALVECRLDTGRRNQIRVHMADLGCPVVGDRKYGWRHRKGENLRPRRPLLHAWRIAFDHPVTGARIEVESPPPEPELVP